MIHSLVQSGGAEELFTVEADRESVRSWPMDAKKQAATKVCEADMAAVARQMSEWREGVNEHTRGRTRLRAELTPQLVQWQQWQRVTAVRVTVTPVTHRALFFLDLFFSFEISGHGAHGELVDNCLLSWTRDNGSQREGALEPDWKTRPDQDADTAYGTSFKDCWHRCGHSQDPEITDP